MDREDKLARGIPGWLSATSRLRLPVSLSSREMERRVSDLQAALREGGASAAELGPADEKLAVLSSLCFALSRVSRPSSEVLAEAAAAFDLVSSVSWPDDEFGEKAEIAFQLSFLGWRHATGLGLSSASEQWLERCGRTLRDDSVFKVCLTYLLETPISARSPNLAGRLLDDPSNLLAFCLLVREQADVLPQRAFSESNWLYAWLLQWPAPAGWEAEKSHLLGETALTLSICARHLGHRDDAESWLQQSGVWFSQSPAREGRIGYLAYLSLALLFEAGQYAEVLDAVGPLGALFEGLGSRRNLAKCRLLEGLALKASGKTDEAIAVLEILRPSALLESEPDLLAFATVASIELNIRRGDRERTSQLFVEAGDLLRKVDRPMLVGEMLTYAGELARQEGRLDEAIDVLKTALEGYQRIGMAAMAARVRLVLAETLLALHRDSEAEAEIRAAMPAMEKAGLGPEGLAAVAILRECLRRRKADPRNPVDLREHLKGEK